jgi:rhodanese-related sulfurtransferase
VALEGLGSAALVVLVSLLGIYVLWRMLRRLLAQRQHRATPSVSPQEVVKMVDGGEPLLIVDARSLELASLARIPGAVSAPVNEELPPKVATLAKGVRVFAYCDCPQDTQAARLARKLAQSGHTAFFLAGGISAWSAAGLPVET